MLNQAEYDYLLSVAAIRQRSEQIMQLALENNTCFRLELSQLPKLADFVVTVIKENYPSTKIPLHSRWRHFVINGQDRAQALHSLPPLECAKAQLDLAMISVLLDAGAGAQWQYRDSQGNSYSRSEGLAIASLELFLAGFFSADPQQPWRVDAEALLHLTAEQLATGFQVTAQNPLLGLEGRWRLLHRLGHLLAKNNALFSQGRPAGLYDYLTAQYGARVSAPELVKILLCHLNPIWPGREVDGFQLGDVWHYAKVGWIPFHKLTLWLTLSFIEPLQTANLRIDDLDQLPGLAEYRNGGLFVDGGVLVIKDQQAFAEEYAPADPMIIEWRALTIALLEKLAPLVRTALGVKPHDLPLVNILQGGTWQAGRQLALRRSASGEPPIHYTSTGTVF